MRQTPKIPHSSTPSAAPSADAQAMQMLQIALSSEEANLKLRQQLAALDGVEEERDHAVKALQAMQLQIDDMTAERNKVSKQIATMVDERAAVQAAWSQLGAERAAFDQEKKDAGDMQLQIDHLEQQHAAGESWSQKLQSQLQLYTTKCMQLTEAYLELEQANIAKEGRLQKLFDHRAEMEFEMQLLQNAAASNATNVAAQENQQPAILQQIEVGHKKEQPAAALATLNQELESISIQNRMLISDNGKLTKHTSAQSAVIEERKLQVSEAERELAGAKASVKKLQLALDETTNRERHKTEINGRLVEESSQLNRKVRIIRQELDSAEVEKEEAFAKLTEQVHITAALKVETQQLRNHIANR